MTLHRFVGPLLAAVLVLGGCEAREEAPPVEEVDLEGETSPGEAEVEEEEIAPTPGVLTPVDRSGVRGTAGITREDDDLLVVVEASGLEPGTRYTTHVQEGRCADGGPVSLPLGRVVADDEGRGSVRMRLERERLPEDEGLFVQVHALDDRAVACANLETGVDGS